MIGNCSLCGYNEWKKIDPTWSRCKTCGRLEMKRSNRTCVCCGKPIGKYAKLSKVTCIDCKEIPFESQIPCRTYGCGNKLGHRADPSGYCRQCLREMDQWETPNGHLWKSKALRFLRTTMAKIDLLNALLRHYPELTIGTLSNWLSKQTSNRILKKIKRGVYQATLGENPTPRTNSSPRLTYIDPAKIVVIWETNS